MERSILHCDFNNFYASVETLADVALQGRPVAVTGDPKARHGVVLSKNELAKKAGVRTGDVLWQARQKCPDIVFTPVHFERYLAYSARAREIYFGYTDRVEPFGLDECWLDMTRYRGNYASDRAMADAVRRRIQDELGLTISVGASFNKVFAKLGSDLQKPDATTVITRRDFRETVWKRPVQELLYVGPATAQKLAPYGITTIGALARANVALLRNLLGKNGVMLWNFANGNDTSQVSPYAYTPPVKSIGNSTTAPRDLCTDDEVKVCLLSLCESVAARLREQRCVCRTLVLTVRDCELQSYDRQGSLPATDSTGEIFRFAFALYRQHHAGGKPVRSLAVTVRGLSPAPGAEQLSLFPEDVRAMRARDLDRTVDAVRQKYGYGALRRGIALCEPALDADIRGEHLVHPPGFLGTLGR